MTRKEVGSRKYGTFSGVFVPTFLTIVGVILFLRLGYIVGEGGLWGSIAVILLAISVTVSTGLALSSIVTNIRVGGGGAYSIISKTLGLEVGGSVGIPLFLAQALSVALYIFGFSETWRYIFPSHNLLLVLFASFLVLFLITFISTKLAIKTQIIVFILIIASLVSVFMGGNWIQNITMPSLESFPMSDFWVLFALFFPAATGLMAGIGMSGELEDPKSQIPKGVLTGLGVSALIYIAMVFFLYYSASSELLIEESLIIVELAKFAPIVLIGILASTFSSALTTLVAAPRVLQALASNSLLPFSGFLSKKSKEGEPRNAVIITGAIIAIALYLGNLNMIAPILTMFFLLTYSVINLAVFLEQSLELVGFRPTFKIPKIIPLYGFVASIIFMFYINIIAGIVALLLLIAGYIYLVNKEIEEKKGDVRSGLFFAISEWAARQVNKLQESREHIWKPHIFLPARSSKMVYPYHHMLKAMLSPRGTISILDMSSKEKDRKKIRKETEKFDKEGLFTNYTTVKTDNYIGSIDVALEAVEGQFFHPNIAYIPTSVSRFKNKSLKGLIKSCNVSETGLMFFRDNKIGLGKGQEINIWIPEEVLDNDFYEDRYFDLAMLMAYKLKMNWDGEIIINMRLKDHSEMQANRYLNRLVYEARFPKHTTVNLISKPMREKFKESEGELHIIPFKDLEELRRQDKKTKDTKNSYLFFMDSGEEDILA